MRIGVLTTSFPRFEGDVAGSFVLGLSRALAARGHALSVLAPAPAERLPPPDWPGLELSWVRYMWPPAWQRTFYGAGAPDNLRRDPRALLGVAPALGALAHRVWRERGRWDALITHWALPCGLLGAAFARGARHLAIVHSADLHLLERMPGRRAIAARIAGGSQHLLFVTPAQRARFLALLPAAARAGAERQSGVQAMGVDLPPDTPSPPSTPLGPGPEPRFVLLALSRLVPIKGLAEALRVLRDRRDLALWIGGEGPERARLAELARGARLEVRLLGHVAGARKAALLREADAFLLPSRVLPSGRTEGVPTAVLEAMAHRLPVVAARVGGLPALLDEGRDGLLFDPRRPSELHAAIDRLRDDPALRARLAQDARRKAEAHAWPEVAARVEALLSP